MSVNRKTSLLEEAAKKEREAGNASNYYNTKRQAESSAADKTKNGGSSLLEEAARREREERKTTQRQTTSSAANSQTARDLAVQRMKQAQTIGQKIGSTSVGKLSKPTSHSGSSGTWAENSNPAYKQWAANNQAQAGALENKSKTEMAKADARNTAKTALQTGKGLVSASYVDPLALQLLETPTAQLTFRSSAEAQLAIDVLEGERQKLTVTEPSYGLVKNPDMGKFASTVELKGKIDEIKPILKRLEEEEKQALIDSGEYRDASFFGDAIANSFNKMYYQAELGKAYADRNEAAIKTYEDELASDKYKYFPSNWLETGVSFVAEQAGLYANMLSDPLTQATALGAAGTAAVLGNAGPQALIPEEFISVPTAYGLGAKAGITAQMYKIEAGLAYRELLEAGVSPETASLIASGTGVINAGIELLQIDELAKSAKILTSNPGTQNIGANLAKSLYKYGVNVFSNTAEEVAQELTTIGGVQLGSKIDTGEYAYSGEEVSERIGETAKSSALGFGFMSGVGSVAGYTVNKVADIPRAKSEAKVKEAAEKVKSDSESLGQIVDYGKSRPEGTKAHDTAVRIEDKMRDGEEVTTDDVAELIVENSREYVNENIDLFKDNEQLTQALIEDGQEFGGAASDAAAVVARKVNTGKEVTREDILRLMTENEKAYEKKATEAAYRNFTGYGEKGVAMFAEELGKDGADEITLKGKMDAPYHAGRFGVAQENIDLSDPLARQAYNVGEQDRILDIANDKKVAEEASVWGKEAGLIKNEHSKSLPLSKQSLLDEYAKQQGVKIVARDRLYTGNGSEANGRINDAGIMEVSMNADNPIGVVVTHEGLHNAKKNAPEQWEAFRDLAVKIHFGEYKPGTKDVITRQRDSYYRASNGEIVLDSLEAAEEVATHFAERLMNGDEALLEEFVSAARAELAREEATVAENATVEETTEKSNLRKFLDSLIEWCKTQIAKLKAMRKSPSIKNNSIAIKELDSTIDNMEHAVELLKSLFVESAKTVQAKREAGKVHTETAQKNTTTESGGDRYALAAKNYESFPVNRELLDIVERVKSGEFIPNKKVYFGTVSQDNAKKIYDETGIKVDGFRVAIEARQIEHILKQHGEHGLANQSMADVNDVAKMEFAFTSPDSINNAGRSQAYSHMENGRNKTAPTVLYERLMGEKSYYVVQAVPDTKAKTLFVVTAFIGDPGYSEQKKEASQLINAKRPDATPKSGSVVTSDNKLAQSGKNVKKNYSLKDSTGKSLTDQQAEFFKDSKVVDGKGRLKVMYQGGDGDFTVFDRKKSSYSNLYGRGFYFTDSESHASQYGKARPFYLNITNPVSTTERTITKSQMRAFLEAVAENEDDYGLENYGYGATVDSVLKSVFSGKSDFAMLYDVSQTAIGDMIAAVELFNEVNGTDFDGFILDTETVTFRSEQAKLTDNETPTKSPDVRFSLKTPVEETDRLIALHNMSEDALRGAIELGGFAMPSIAVTRANMGHTSFGDISLVFGKDTISPTDRRNTIFSGDAYTPSFPSIGYKINDRELTKVRSAIYKHLDGTDAKRAFWLSLDEDNVKNAISRSGGSFKEAYRRNEAMQIAFLKDKGIPFRPVMQEKSYSDYVDNSVLRKIDRALGGRTLEVMNGGFDEAMKHEQLVRKLINDYYESAGAGRIYDKKFGFADVDSILHDVVRYMRDGAKKEIDVAETRTRLANKFTKKLVAEYEAWLDELGEGVVEKKGVRNDRDMFTPSGNRRSFEQLHFEYSLENIVRVMQGQAKQGADTFVGGSGNIRGASAKTYSSVENARAEVDRLQSMTYEEKDEKYSAFDDKCFELCQRMVAGRGLGMFADNDAASALAEALAKHKTEAGLYRYLNREYGMIYNVTPEIAHEAIELMKEAQNLPVEYFEAKPYRAVGFDEVLAVVAPSNMDKGLKQTLFDMGVTVKTYKNGDHDARLKAVNSVNGARFSLKGVRELEDAHKQAEINDLLRKELKGVQKALGEQIAKTEKWKGELKRTKEPTVDKKSVDKLTRKIVREYSSDVDVSEISAQLKELGDDLLRVNTDEGLVSAKAKADEIARAIVEESRETYVDSYLDEIKKTIRGSKIFVPEWVRRSIPDYEDFRRRNFGRMRLNHKDGVPIDVFWNDMNDQFGDFFNEQEVINSVDQLLKLEEIVESATPLEFNPFVEGGAADEVIDTLGYELMVKLLHDVDPTPPTFADKQYEKRKQAVKEAKAQVRETERERANKRLTEERAKAKERLNRLLTEQKQKARERYEKKLEKATSYYREQMANASESRKAMELREKITRHVDKMSRKLLKPTKTQNIPVELHQAVADVLAAINMDSNFEWVVGSDGKRRRVQKGADPNSTPTKRTEAFIRLRTELENIVDANTYGITLDPNLLKLEGGARNMLQEIVNMYDTPISSMNSAQLTTVWNVLRSVEKSVLDAGKILTNDFLREKYEDRLALANAFFEAAETRKTHTTSDRHWTMDLMDPYTYFSQFGQPGLDFYRMLRNAQDDYTVKKKEIADMVSKIVSAEKRAELEKDIHEFETQAGEKLILSKAHIMDMWLLNNRPQGKQHLLGGGIYQPTIKGKVKKGSSPTRLNEIDLGKIFATLTEEDRKFAQEFRKITDKLAEWADKANVRVYGYEKFGDPNYWTINVNKKGTKQKVNTNPDNSRSVADMSAAKNTVPEARNAVDIFGMFETFDRHASDMLNFAAWLAPSKDAEQLFNIWIETESGEFVNNEFKDMLDRVGGAKSSDYWMELMEDIENGIKGKQDTEIGGFVEQAIGKTRRAAIASNMRVVIQQPTAAARALAVIDPKYLVKGLVKGVTAGKGTDKARKYSPTALRKFEGNFDIGTGVGSLADAFYKPESLKGKGITVAKEGSLWAAGKADELTWGKLWNACEHQIAGTRKDITVGSEEWYAAVKELFDDTIDQTQVVDGILQRSKIMRSGSALTKQLTAFKGEPLKTANMFMRSVNNWRHETDPKKKSAARKKAARSAFALTLNVVVNAVAQSIWDGIRDDDDEEKLLKRALNAFTGLRGDEETWWNFTTGIIFGNLVSGLNPLNYIPLASDVVSIFEGYDVNRPDAEAWSRFMQEVQNTIGALGEDGGKQKLGYSVTRLLTRAGYLFGSGSSNLLRDIESVVRSIQVETDDYEGLYKTEKLKYDVVNNKSKFIGILYRAYAAGDTEAYNAIYNDLIKSGVSEKSITSAMETRMMKAEGVSKASELEERYLSPTKQKQYDKTMTPVKKSPLWSKASAKQKSDAETLARGLVNGSNESAQKKIEGGADIGLTPEEYIIYQLALDVYDEPNSKGKIGGSPTPSEQANAVLAVPGLSDAEMAYLFDGKLNDGKAYRADEAGFDMEEYLLYRIALDKTAKELETTTTSTKAKNEALKQFNFTSKEKAYLRKEDQTKKED